MGFGRRYPGATVIPLPSNYRSTPQVLALANRLLASAGSEKELVATLDVGPEPQIKSFATDAEELAWVVGRVKALIADDVDASEIAVLVRLNAQTVGFEEALAREGIPISCGASGSSSGER